MQRSESQALESIRMPCLSWGVGCTANVVNVVGMQK